MSGTPRFPIGTGVAVRSLGRKRGEVIEARGERYRVRVDGVTVACREDDLEALPQEGKRKREVPRREARAERSAESRVAAGRVDLHGLTVDAAMERVIAEIDRTLQRGADRLEVVHGKGSGIIRAALHRNLAALPVVKAFKLDAGNAGVTWVYF
jgi:DNA mismatch repair protein MutS2